MDQAMLNIRWCMSLLNGLYSAGVTQLVISPGSRSTPLVIAADRHPALQCHVLVDERSAAFYAMGIARYHMMPVALVCTSGSAAANWYPAIVEAAQASIPLVLLSADRPWELQSCDANQTIDQVKLFGGQVRAFHALPPAESAVESLRKLHSLGRQVVAESLWPDPGPVHINMPFREPLVALNFELDVTQVGVSPLVQAGVNAASSELMFLRESLSGRCGLIVCGTTVEEEDFTAEVVQLAEQLNCPILADPLANLRFGIHDRSHVISYYSLFLSGGAAIRAADWIIRFGTMPVSKALQSCIAAPGIQQFVVDPRGRWSDPLNQAPQVLQVSPTLLCRQLNDMDLQPAPSSWCADWLHQEQRCERLLKSAEPALPCEAGVIRQLLANLPDDSLLFSGNSMAIRHLDSYSGKSGKKLQIIANRGVSGIDGNISTFLGLASAFAGKGRPVAVMGDLAFFHDMNGLAAAQGLNAILIIVNNNGGGIFTRLPQKELPGFDKYWRTPLNLEYRHAADLYELPYHKVIDINQFSTVLMQAIAEKGVSLIEVPANADEGDRLQQRLIANIAKL